MQNKTRSNERPLLVDAIRRADGSGTDIWIRTNIEGPFTETVEGFSSTYYEADELFLRTDDQLTAVDVEAKLDHYKALAAAYDPQKAQKPTDTERIRALEKVNAQLQAALDEQTDINNQQDETLLEIFESIGG